MIASKTKPVRFINESGDTETQIGLAKHFNAMMDSLGWFYENGVRIAVKRSRGGYSIVMTAAQHDVKKISKKVRA